MRNQQALVDQIVQNLAFEIEAVPNEKTQRSASISQSTPLDVKIKLRKKDLPTQHHVSSIDDEQGKGGAHKVRLVHSNQTIMTFDLFLESEIENETVHKPHRTFFSTLMPGTCIGTEDDDEYAYMPKPTYTADLTEPSTTTRSGGGLKQNFTLRKNTDKTENISTDTTNYKWFFGKCKPGGCLDPPFSEDRYPYKPEKESKVKQDVKEDSKCKKKKKCKEKRKSRDKTSSTWLGNGPKEDDSISNLYQVDSMNTSSNQLITYPHKKSSDVKINDDRSVKSEDKSRKSFNEHSEPYFIPPKRVKRPREKEDLRTKQRSFEDLNVTNEPDDSLHMPVSIPITVPIPDNSYYEEPVNKTESVTKFPSYANPIHTDGKMAERSMLRTKVSQSELHPESNIDNYGVNIPVGNIILPEETPEEQHSDSNMTYVINENKITPEQTKDSPSIPLVIPTHINKSEVDQNINLKPDKTLADPVILRITVTPSEVHSSIIDRDSLYVYDTASKNKLSEEKPELHADNENNEAIKETKSKNQTDSSTNMPSEEPAIHLNKSEADHNIDLNTDEKFIEPLLLGTKISPSEMDPDPNDVDHLSVYDTTSNTKLLEEKHEPYPADELSKIIKGTNSPEESKDSSNEPIPINLNKSEADHNIDLTSDNKFIDSLPLTNDLDNLSANNTINNIKSPEGTKILQQTIESPFSPSVKHNIIAESNKIMQKQEIENISDTKLDDSKPDRENEVLPSEDSRIVAVTTSKHSKLKDIKELEDKHQTNNGINNYKSIQNEYLSMAPEQLPVIPMSSDNELVDKDDYVHVKSLPFEEPLVKSLTSIHDLKTPILRESDDEVANEFREKISNKNSTPNSIIANDSGTIPEGIMTESNSDGDPYTGRFNSANVLHTTVPITRIELNSTLEEIPEIHTEKHDDDDKSAANIDNTLISNTNDDLTDTTPDRTIPFDDQDVLGKMMKIYPVEIISKPPKAFGDKEKYNDESDKIDFGSATIQIDNPQNQKRDGIIVNLGLLSYVNENNERVVQSFDPASSPKRLPNDKVALIKTNLKPSNELRMPIDLEHELSIQIKKLNRNVRVSIDDTGRSKYTLENDGLETSKAQQSSDGHTRASIPEANIEPDKKAVKDATGNKVLDLYESELVRLQTVIKSIKYDIDLLASQQIMLRDKLYGAKITKIPRLIHANKKCVGCLKFK